jgi:HTH-type transcriptional regulator / antitoxin HipB
MGRAGDLSTNGDRATMSPFAVRSILPRISKVRIQTPDDVGRAIRARRAELGLDQGSLARLVGVSRQWIVEVEHGKPRAEMGLLLRTLSALRLELTLKPAKAGAATPEVFAPGLVDLDVLVQRARGQGR